MEKYIMVVDTETISLEKKFIYDLGLIIAEWNGKEYEPIEKHSLIIKQVYSNKMLFDTAYYADKRPKYVSKLKGKKSIAKHYGHTMRFVSKLIKTYNINKVFAYNSIFDKQAFKFTAKYFGCKNPLDKLQWRDIYEVAIKYIQKSKQYIDTAKEKNWITERGNVQGSAEKVYQFIKNDYNFVESHTGLEDSEIELDILNKCIELGYSLQFIKKQFIKINSD